MRRRVRLCTKHADSEGSAHEPSGGAVDKGSLMLQSVQGESCTMQYYLLLQMVHQVGKILTPEIVLALIPPKLLSLSP